MTWFLHLFPAAVWAVHLVEFLLAEDLATVPVPPETKPLLPVAEEVAMSGIG